MTRLTADILLGLAGLIWGFGFVAQKDAAAHIGPATFVACRFLISALFVLPFVVREGGFRHCNTKVTFKSGGKIFGLCLIFFACVTLQQYGLTTTTVTNAAFITGVYIVLVPFVGALFDRQKLSFVAVLSSFVSLAGIWLLTGGDTHHLLARFNGGDGLVLLCAVCYALQVPMMGRVVGDVRAPFMLSFLQYFSTGLAALVLALGFERIDLHALAAAWVPILYAGVASGGIAYTLQAVAQQHTPAADSAVLMSSESLFGAIGGAWLLHETLGFSGYAGCAAIMASIFLVELAPLLKKKLS